nr:hypothetical protein [Candidatus Njordarchaeum guaymaensis]
MKGRSIALAKLYIVLLGLINYSYFAPLLSIDSSVTGIQTGLTSSWHLVVFIAYLVLPVIAVLMDNYALYVTLAGVLVVRAVAEAFGLFTWTSNLYLMVAPFYALAAVFCLLLAAEDVASKVSGEILSSQWSQF